MHENENKEYRDRMNMNNVIYNNVICDNIKGNFCDNAKSDSCDNTDENRKNRICFRLYLHNQTQRNQTVDSIGFRASNMCICLLETHSNRSWEVINSVSIMESKKSENRIYFWGYLHNHTQWSKTDDSIRIRTSNMCIYVPKRHYNRNWEFNNSVSITESKKSENRICFQLYLDNQRQWSQTKDDIGFRTSNICIYNLERRSNYNWGFINNVSIMKSKKSENRMCFWIYFDNVTQRSQTDDSIGFRASNIDIFISERRSNCSWRFVINGFKKTRKLDMILAIFQSYL